MENNKIINGNCWIAYFDVLGFSYLVESFDVEFIRKKFKEALKHSEQFNAICKFKFFSDTFIFYTENDSLDSFLKIRDVTMFFFSVMFTEYNIPHFPMRGCLNVGQLYSNENDGIFFGQALIDAYHIAEWQNWIGFVLSKKAIKKIREYELSGTKTKNERWFQEYNVPYKEEAEKSLLDNNTYKLNILHENYPKVFRSRLSIMGSEALDLLPENDRCSKCEKILAKYKNTEDYLVFLYPSLEKENKMFDKDELCSTCSINKKKI